MLSSKFTFYEFFAGGGMVRAGLGDDWKCLLANDFDRKKAQSYLDNWGDDALVCDDIRNLSPEDLTGVADLAWASFPCQDLSLAGGGAGLRGDRSGTFWPFISHMAELKSLGRPPSLIVLENVLGTLTSHNGKDFIAISNALDSLDYKFGAVVVNASHFVPQSRPRLFFIAFRNNVDLPVGLVSDSPSNIFHSPALVRAYNKLPLDLRNVWNWWSLPKPKKRQLDFIDLIEDRPNDVHWHSKSDTDKLLSMMSDKNLAKVKDALNSGSDAVGGVYKRTRYENGMKVQRAEVRFDNIAGCLRTPAGGSSRQLILRVKNGKVSSRLISSRETARLMGLGDSYILPSSYNEAYHLTGDGVVVPVVKFLRKSLFEPILLHNYKSVGQENFNEKSHSLRT